MTIQTVVQIIVGILGGYVLMSAYVALSSILMAKLGMQLGEAVMLNSMLGLMAYLFVLLWGFTTTKGWRTSAIITCTAAGMMIASMCLPQIRGV
jgi:hypothetical protein